MRCPFCGHGNPGEGQPPVGRRRAYPPPPGLPRIAALSFTTFERVQLREIMVVKRDRAAHAVRPREAGGRSVDRRCASARWSRERIDQMVSGIVRQLESLGETEIPSSHGRGDFVMKALKARR